MRARSGDWNEWLAGLNASSTAAQRQLREANTRERLARARAYIDTRFDEPLDLDAIAHQAAFSPFHFHRLFRREFDATPHQYLTGRRIDRAKQLLEATDMAVTDVCLEVGFSSLGSFSNLFRRRVGHSPNRYRRVIIQAPELLETRVPNCFLAMFAARA